MRMPGFTADVSLDETRGHFQAAATGAPVARGVQPAASRCYDRCYRNCLAEGGFSWECQPICFLSCRRGGFAV